MRVLLSALVALSVCGTVPAKAGVVFELFHTSTTIPVGGSITFTGYTDVLPNGSLQDIVQAFYPEYYVTVWSYDWSTSTNVQFTSPGSTDGSATLIFGNMNWSGSMAGLPATLTYDQPGLYKIDYSYGAWGMILPIGNAWDSPEQNQSIYGPFLSGPTYSAGGSGSIEVRVGAVPEPSTWAMMLIGFALIAIGSYRTAGRLQAIPALIIAGGIVEPG